MNRQRMASAGQNRSRRRSKDELLDWVGSSYSKDLGISYRPCSKQEAWDVYLDGGTVVFSEEASIDDAFFAVQISKVAYHKVLGFDRERFSFNDLCRQMREKMASSIGPNHELHIAVVV